MRIKHHIGENKRNIKIQKKLDELKIRYKNVGNLIIFDIFEDQVAWNEISQFVVKYNMSDMVEIVYSKKEIENADWVRIRSKWYWDYPLPDQDMGFKKITYDLTDYCDECGIGKKQKALFCLRNEPKWKNKQFLQLYWIYDELFINPDAYNILINNNVTGISNYFTLNHRTGKNLDTIIQLKIENILQNGYLTNDSNKICKKCKREKFTIPSDSQIQFKKEIFENQYDFIKSNEFFGDGTQANRLIFISNKVVKLIYQQKWKNLVLEPIKLI